MDSNKLQRYNNTGRLKISQLPKGENNRALCRYCGIEVPPNRVFLFPRMCS